MGRASYRRTLDFAKTLREIVGKEKLRIYSYSSAIVVQRIEQNVRGMPADFGAMPTDFWHGGGFEVGK